MADLKHIKYTSKTKYDAGTKSDDTMYAVPLEVTVNDIKSGSQSANKVIKSDGNGGAVWGDGGGASGTTLADYGITDAKIESVGTVHTITLGSHTITFEVVGNTLNITTT